jgi:hypothetical protein
MEQGIRLSFVKTSEFQGGFEPPLGTPLFLINLGMHGEGQNGNYCLLQFLSIV